MKNYFILMLSLFLVICTGCSDNDLIDSITLEDLDIKTKNGLIEEPAWLKNAVTIGEDQKIYGIVKAIDYKNNIYIHVTNPISSSFCVAWQYYELDGTSISCMSELYNSLMECERDESKSKIIWTSPDY